MSREIELVLVDKTKNYLRYGVEVAPNYSQPPEIIANAYLIKAKYGEKIPKSVKLVIEE